MSDLITQLIRTAAQAVAGALLTWFATSGVDLGADPEVIVGLLFAVFTTLWAVATTWLAANVHPIFGFLSIVRRAPTYGVDS